MEQDSFTGKKILLALLPYWTPQIPPLGISCLKSFLQAHGYQVKTVDVNVETKSRTIYDKYFNQLRTQIPGNKRGNFYNIGHEVLQNHMMAHLFYPGEDEYISLVKTLVSRTFYNSLPDQGAVRLNDIIEEFYTWFQEFFLGIVEQEKPLVMGLSVTKGNLPASVFAFKQVKEKYPHIQTVMGGPVFAQNLGVETRDFQYFLEKTAGYIDKIIVGEGEQLFLHLLEGKLDESQRVYTLDAIDGRVVDLSGVDVPDFSDLPVHFYPGLAAYTSRSCPYRCSFCTETVYWGKYRKKSAPQVVRELMTLYRQYHAQLFLLGDSLLNPVIEELANELAACDVSLYWDGYLRIDEQVCDADAVWSWRKGGFYRARLGVESGSLRMLAAMGKKITIRQIKTALSNLANAGIKTTTYWIIGYPGETEADFQQTLDLIEYLKDDIYEAECNPFGFYLSGQVNSEQWNKGNQVLPLYPEETRRMVLLQSWHMECEPPRQVTYQRVNRFVRHCESLGISNPYSLVDIANGDQRWKKLHKHAVPPLLEFKGSSEIDENKHLQRLSQVKTALPKEIVFGFEEEM